MNSLRASAGLLERRHWFLLYVLGAAAFFEGYDLNIVAVALPQLRRSFHLTQADASLWVSLLFFGALPAVVFTRQADRRGRRLVLLVSILGYTAATGLTAVATTMGMFVGCQFFARMFLSTEDAVAWTLVAEELPAGARGFGFGWLAMLAAAGTGTSAIIYGAVLSPLGLSWRLLYVFALPPCSACSCCAGAYPRAGGLPEPGPGARWSSGGARSSDPRIADGWSCCR